MAEAGPDAATPAAALLDALRASGAEGRDPVRFRFLEALARRAEGHSGEARRRLDERLVRAATALGERCAASPSANALATGDSAPPASPLAELLAHIRDHALPEAPSHPHHAAADVAPRGELKSVAYFQRTWSQMSIDQQLAQALAQVPENAGPFNPEFLAMRALQRLREIAPAYLRHWLPYLDGLIWLEQAGATGRAGPGKRKKTKGSGRKAKAG